jgi:hypothetical protein
MKKFSRIRITTLAVITLLSVGAAACGDDSTTSNGTGDTTADTTADTSAPSTEDTTAAPTPDTATGPNPSSFPTQVTCEGDVCRVTGEITESFTMGPDKQWVLEAGVYIGDDTNETVLTIEPGTTVYGDTASKAFLCVRRGSKIMAEGSKDAPIVLTSAKLEGDRARGDWGGLVLNGRAPINGCATGTEVCEAEGEGATGLYGGSDVNDNSGTLRYVRVEFAGHPITPENELNGIAFQGVGAATTLEYIQVHMADDDGVEFFGGTAQFKYILTTGISDDNLDWTDGWQGKGQFFVAKQYDGAGDQGIEADNNGENNDLEPRSQPHLSNLTLVGDPESKKSDIGILLREGTGANISNTIVYAFEDACFDIDNKATYTNAYDGTDLTGDLTVTNTIFACGKINKSDDEETDPVDGVCPEGTVEEMKDGKLECALNDPFVVADFLFTWNTGNTQPELPSDGNWAGFILTDALNDAPDFRPSEGSPALSGASVPDDAFFEQVDFIGGVDPANDWTAGWTTNAQN